MSFRVSPRLALVIIAGIFLLPLVAAWLMYSGAVNFQPATTRNLGNLVQPPVPVELADVAVASGTSAVGMEELEDHWVVMHIVPGDCDAACNDAVTALRQIHRAAGRNQSRIRI